METQLLSVCILHVFCLICWILSLFLCKARGVYLCVKCATQIKLTWLTVEEKAKWLKPWHVRLFVLHSSAFSATQWSPCPQTQAWLAGCPTVTPCMPSSETTERRKRFCSTSNIASCSGWGDNHIHQVSTSCIFRTESRFHISSPAYICVSLHL